MLVRCRYFYLQNRLENQYNTVELAIISKSLEPLGAIREIDDKIFALLEHSESFQRYRIDPLFMNFLNLK